MGNKTNFGGADPLSIQRNGGERARLAAAVRKMARNATNIGDTLFDTLEIDLATAQEILANHNNPYTNPTVVGRNTRTNRPFHADYTLIGWAKDMVNGDWVLQPQGLAFDTAGNLLDGQNRMKALVMANERWEELLDTQRPGAAARYAEIQANGVRIPMVVSYGWNPEVFDRIDRGKPRSLSDLLAVTGELDRHYLAATGRIVWQFDDNPELARIPASEHMILEFVRSRQPWMSEAIADARQISGESRSRLLASGAAAGVYVIRRAWPRSASEIEADVDTVGEFLYGVGHGVTLDSEGRRLPLAAGDPRAALRSYLNNPAGRKDRERRRHMGLLIKTWNRWIEGRTVEVLKLLRTEDFPVPVVREGAVWDEASKRYVLK